jgi:hypothetical protein
MATIISNPTAEELSRMDAMYRQGGQERGMAPHVVYADGTCPHPDCNQHLQAIDFRLEDYRPAVHDPLVRAWWSEIGFAGQCPTCGGWIHFTIHGKRAITAEEASVLPRLPEDWHKKAVIL